MTIHCVDGDRVHNLKMAGASVATVFLVLTSLICSSHGQTNAVNVAVNKPISAMITCGTPPEIYYAQSEGLRQVTQRVESLCDASNSSFAHPPELMVDLNDPTSGDVFTWWQSTSRNMLLQAGLINPDTIITLNLLESYLVEYVSIQMGDSARPGSMTLLRSSDGISYSVWEYKVTVNSDCLSDYNVDVKSIVDSDTTVLCSTYGRTEQQQYETIQFTMPVPEEFIEWRRAQYLRFEFHDMPRKFGLLSDIFHHYTVRNIVVTAECECNGHASDCTLQPSEEDPEKETYQCVCGGNTGGISCDQCLPFFNQLPYQQGYNNFACLECNCFQHSEVCYYDSVIGAINGSLSGAGRYHGGGVCQNCMNNTAGINCERCVEYHYRPLTSVQTDVDACQPCDCYLDGTREDPSIGLNKGHCVMNNDTLLPIGMVPGDCYCKDNVIGSKCDECRNGYFHLADSNPEGCTSCNCFTAGTDNGTAVCIKDSSGQCPCKTFVIGRRCDTCQDEFYALSSDNLEGCLPCECNVGGAINNLCDKGSGQCICKNYVSGRQCDRPLLMSYYPTVHFINAEFETTRSPYWERDDATNPGYSYFGYLAITGALTVSTTITVPTTQLSGRTEIVLRYSSQSVTTVSVSISPGELTSGSMQMGQATLTNCLGEWCYDPVYNLDQSQGLYFQVEPGDWTVNVFVNMEGEAKLYLDQVILIPEEFLNPVGVLEPIIAQQFVTTCDVQNNDMRIGTETEEFCLSSVFIITTTYLDGNLQCNCDLAGSVSNNCDPYGGQCPCQPGVGGRRCDVCLPEFYDFRSTGCKACNCYSDEKVCDSLTGQCDCPTNTVGRQCDRCVTYAWGLNSTTGCKMCNCNSIGSVSLQCNALDGTCFCHPGVGGEKCTECLEGFRTLTSAGCTSCQCDIAGSYNGTCNVTTGQCPCKENTEGILCQTCSSSSFHISEMYDTGCLDCVCMGVTSECSSSSWKYSLFQIPTNNDALWSVAANRFATELSVELPIPTLMGGVSYMSISVPAGNDLYWWPMDGPFLDGNLLHLYGNDVRFVLYYEAPASIASPITEPRALLSGLGNRYTYTFDPVLNATLTPVSITIEETNWRTETTDEQISRQDFMKTLSRVDFFLISATLFFDEHLSSIGNFYYNQATAPGSEFYDPRAATSLAVEDCNCGLGYSGLSCEECAADYYRTNVTNHPYFGVCISCTCNGHSDSCDPSNGQCIDCQHNTTGINCEICANGTYGDATAGTENDCTDCPCGPPKADDARCDVIEGVVTCLSCLPGHVGPLCDSCETFYFGEPELEDGFCEECNCSGNSLECNTRTGQCIDCQSRTTGFNCERCENSTYGDASLQMCQDCNCHVLGSINLPCNHRSGQCPCKYGVGTLTCAQCMDNFYGFGLIEGCIACECNELGSTSLQCNEQGLCNCFGGAVGDKCDICSQGYYGLPTQSCQSCSCDLVGTLVPICDVMTGQCPCRTGVGGRTCSQCMPTWINFGITGCESKLSHSRHGQRVNSLQAAIRSTESTLLEVQTTVDATHEILDIVDVTLMRVDVVLNATQYQISYSDSIVEGVISTLAMVDASILAALESNTAGDADFLAALIIKDGASTGYTGIPIDQSINQYSINGWSSAMVASRFRLNDLRDLQPVTEQTVVLAENTAFTLANTAQDTVAIFSAAQVSGQRPVDIFDHYEGVVTTINEAEAVIQNANDTIAATTSFLDTVSVDTLMSQANSSKVFSRLTLDVVELRTTDPEALNDTLTVAYNGISDSEALWDTIEADTASLEVSANSLALLAANPMIQPAINMGVSDSAAASTTSNNVITNSAALDGRVLTNAAEIAVVQDSITNSTMLLNQIPVVADVGQIETDISDLTVMVDQLEILRNETAAQRVVVTDRLALLQQKLLLAQEAVANSKQPVRFAPDSSISVARAPTVQALFNELNMDLKTDLRDGLAFFVENPDTGALFSIEVVTSHVLFKYNLGQDLVTIESPIDVCCGEWYHVVATRYGHEGQLSVEKLSTGGASTDFGSSVITYDMYMNLGSTSLYYVGGIPSEYETDKVQSRDFEGCIANVVFDGQELDLWRPVRLTGSTSCCPRPDLPDLGTDTLIDGLSFSGFGYFQLINTQEDFNIYQQARISIEFRTSISDGVVFLITRQDLISYIGIFMEANKIVFEMNTAGNVKYRLTSNRDFNNAEWVQVTTAFNASYYSMQIRAANISQTLLFHQESRTYAPLSFANLRVSSKVMIGSPDPDLNSFIVRGPTNLKFAGCVRNLQLSYASSMILVPRPLNNETVADFQDVSFDGCLEQVVPGVGFSGDYAYGRLSLPAELAQVQRIYIQFKTLEPDAILAYSWDAESFNKLFYIALYHGNIFVQYNIGEGLTEPLQTKGLRLNNGQWQTVTVEFTGLSATIRVNSMPLILSNRQLSTDGILITGSNSYLYVGGVLSTIPNLIGGEFPVRESLNGDIRNFMINDVTPNFNDDAVLTAQQGITLSGVTPPVATLPPLPYVTEAPPTSITPMPMCSDLPDVFLYPDVFRFGLEDNSYVTFPLSDEDRQYFLYSFVITIEFRAISPNGILYYAASNALLPREWIALVIIDGYLEFSMISNARSIRGIGIRTKQKYDNGEWIKVTVLRINEFVAILVTETRDYANNNQPSNAVTSRISIGTDFNLGGISPSILLSTFPLTFTTGFDGCIKNVEIQTDDIPQDLILNFRDPSLYFAQSVETCSLNDVIPGAFFNGTGYLQLENNFVVGDSLHLSMTIRTTVRETILFAVSLNVENFVALDIFEGGVRAIVSHSSSSPYIVRSSVFVNGYEICDNLPHTVDLSFTQLGLQLTVDSYPPDITYFSPGVPTVVTNSPIYFGGIPETGAVQLISGIVTNSFTGCIQTILLNDVQRNPRDNVDSVGMTTGCPFPLT
ncbi:laminin subunit alpha-1-like [Anneissia japonica]|uniref:laminin subunit alpha-1-like n=1 Tax=Anneissia japonica TaxID=1529436 RepID=UPI00142577FF|nr:laminin subunit alpha-1-like [Anneissia japonica]